MRILLALECLLAQVARQYSDPAPRQARLAWWAAELDRLSQGKPSHPVAVATHQILARKGVSSAPVQTLFAAIMREANENFPGTADELLAHAGQRGAIVSLIADMLIGRVPAIRPMQPAFEQLGRARFLAMELGAGHAHEPAGPHGKKRAQMLRTLAVQQKHKLEDEIAGIPMHDRIHFTPLLVMAGQLRFHLDAMAGGVPASKLSRLMRAWRDARRANRGKLPVWILTE